VSCVVVFSLQLCLWSEIIRVWIYQRWLWVTKNARQRLVNDELLEILI